MPAARVRVTDDAVVFFHCDTLHRLTGKCVMPTDGIFAVVLNEGVIRPGDQIEVESI